MNRNKQYYQEHKEQLIENNKQYYWKNPEEIRQKHREYYAKNRQKILQHKKIMRNTSSKIGIIEITKNVSITFN
jgi:esterase/lipase